MRLWTGLVTLSIVALGVGCDRTCGELHEAVARDDLPRMEQLVSNGTDVSCADSDGWAPIHVAAREGRAASTDWLLAHGADLETRGHVGRGPLYEAAKAGQVAMVRSLLDRGAAVDARSDAGFTPLIVAAEYRHREVVELLLARGADVNAAQEVGDTPLLQLLEHLETGAPDTRDDPTLARLLISHGAWLEVHDISGSTPLHVAVDHGYLEVARALLDAGANPHSVRSANGNSPLGTARFRNHAGLLALLEEHARWKHTERARRATPPGSVTVGGRVTRVSGPNAPPIGERCEVTLRPYDGGLTFNCQLEARCGARHLYGRGGNGFVMCEQTDRGWRAYDLRGTPDDQDPATMLELSERWFFADDGLPAPRGTSVQLELDATPPS